MRSSDGNVPIAGAAVIVIGGRQGTITRDDGRYSIDIAPGTYRLKASRIGFAPDSASNVVVAANGVTNVDFTLKQTTIQLSGVVVVGYGKVEQRDRTGVVDNVTEKDFNVGRIVSPEQLIQAKVPGVQVVDNNEPGGGIAIRIRGGTSVNASNEPLIVVDGVPMPVGFDNVTSGRNPLNFLNPSDIQSMSVLKDASATAIYGSRGANGVILITTKSGLAGAPVVTYNSSYSASSVVRKPQMMNASQFAAAVAQYAPSKVAALGGANTDWLAAMLHQSGGQEQDIAMSGGKDDMHYRLSLGYLNQDGILLGSNVHRVNLGLTYSDNYFGDKLEFRANIKGSKEDDQYTPNGGIGSAIAMAPTSPIRNADGSFFQFTDPLAPNNPVADLNQVTDNGNTYRSVGNLEAKYNLPWLSGLSATTRLGYDYAAATRGYFSPSNSGADTKTGRGGYVNRSNNNKSGTVLEAFANWAPKLQTAGDAFDMTAGYSYEQSNGTYAFLYAQNLATNLLGQYGIPTAKTNGSSYNVDENKLISFFGRANYTWHDRLLLTASIRRDGSSRFGPGNQWGVFPSVAGAWRLIEEPWFGKTSWLSDLKLRASWGVNGNQAIGNYLFDPTYQFGGPQAQYQFGNQYVSTIRPSAVDPNIKWEQTTSTNVGFDYGLFNDRVTGTIDWYTKKTKDLIFYVPVAAGTNLSNYVTTNIGSMQNTGFELGINWVVLDGRKSDWRYDANFALSSNQNKLLSVTGNGSDQILTGAISGGVGSNIQVLTPGQPVNSFFVYRHKVGADGKPVGGNATDIQMYVDQNGDGQINQADRVAYKSPDPKFIIGHTSTVSYKAWDFSATLRAYLGNYTYNNIASNFGNYRGLTNGVAPVNVETSALKYGFTQPQYLSDLYVENASFLRLDNISAGYTFKNLPNLREFKSIRVYGAIQNVFTITGYTGVDPTAGVNGIDNNLYPASRTFTLGLNVGF
ncbi:MAG: SusC/RagA family TonB-linked outer membrane protein [Gemmatimonadetes bacterium]|nr:SusC/RagA family TonB-linked outer membrane protein [Gemmatimonadota bacterium]MBI3567959.1 SusC/RagA family TonB-linked outer membrane protein [Gemmatimonadota bacterium]